MKSCKHSDKKFNYLNKTDKSQNNFISNDKSFPIDILNTTYAF